MIGGVQGGAASAAISYNVIRDFLAEGVLVVDARAYIARNSIRFQHPDEEECPSGTFEFEFVCRAIGIRLFPGAAGTVLGNHVYADGPFDGAVDAGSLWLRSGISSVDTVPGDVRITDNLVAAAFFGVEAVRASGIVIAQNEFRYYSRGISLHGVDGAQVDDNVATLGEYGIFVDNESIGNLFRDNTALDNSNIDCVDLSAGSGTAGTANTWTDNFGRTDSPEGICEPPQ